MNLEEYRVLFLVVTLVLALIVASPVVSMIVPQGSSERFSEFWLLGPDHLAEGYPLNVAVGEMYSVFVGVDNHMGCSECYLVKVKFRNITQPLPDISGSIPSSLPTLSENMFFISDRNVWESPVIFGFQDVSVEDDVLFVGDIIVDGIAFPVNTSARWASEDNGFYFELFFELWRCNVDLKTFSFANQYVGILLNITSSQ